MSKQPSKKVLESQVATAWKRIGNGIQINIMDISKVMDIGVAALKEGRDLDTELLIAVTRFRKN